MTSQPERDFHPVAAPLIVADPAPSKPQMMSQMLTLRVLSSAVLLPLGVAAIWLGGLALGIAAGIAGVAMAYEWSKMQTPERPLPTSIVLGVGAALCPLLSAFGHVQWMAPFLAGCAIVAALLRDNWVARLESFCGAIYVAAPGAAFVWVRNRPDDGLTLALGVALTIWASDIAAYFVGRAVGGPKIFPETSPKKTWAGFLGGAAAGALAASIVGAVVSGAWVLWLLAGAVISVVGQFGDMFESLVKRHFKVKDASGLIPGHGGVMDRLDALMAASLFCAIVLNWAPSVTPDVHLADSASAKN
ncbi:MAG: phosphatidate cytidylyltransferase [Caulobacterales bacterium]